MQKVLQLNFTSRNQRWLSTRTLHLWGKDTLGPLWTSGYISPTLHWQNCKLNGHRQISKCLRCPALLNCKGGVQAVSQCFYTVGEASTRDWGTWQAPSGVPSMRRYVKITVSTKLNIFRFQQMLLQYEWRWSRCVLSLVHPPPPLPDGCCCCGIVAGNGLPLVGSTPPIRYLPPTIRARARSMLHPHRQPYVIFIFKCIIVIIISITKNPYSTQQQCGPNQIVCGITIEGRWCCSSWYEICRSWYCKWPNSRLWNGRPVSERLPNLILDANLYLLADIGHEICSNFPEDFQAASSGFPD